MSLKLHTEHTFSIATWNIAMAIFDEKFPDTKFDVRFYDIVKQIREANADILFVQEALRDIPGCTQKCHALLAALSDMYDYDYAYYNSSKLAFGVVIFYKRDVFHVCNKKIVRYPLHEEDQIERSPIDDKIALGCKLEHVVSGNKFWAFSTHLALKNEDKWEAVRHLVSKYGEYDRIIIAGDYNFFKNADGEEQREEMLKHFDDLAYPLQDGYSGTFCGFKQDRYGPSQEELASFQLARLDHIFSRGFGRTTEFATVEGDIRSIKTQQYPSDHVMISTHVFFN